MGDQAEETAGVYVGDEAKGQSTFIARFLSTKHSWKGKYRRIMSIADNWYASNGFLDMCHIQPKSFYAHQRPDGESEYVGDHEPVAVQRRVHRRRSVEQERERIYHYASQE